MLGTYRGKPAANADLKKLFDASAEAATGRYALLISFTLFHPGITYSTKYVKVLVYANTMPTPKKDEPRIGMIHGTFWNDVKPKRRRPRGAKTAP